MRKKSKIINNTEIILKSMGLNPDEVIHKTKTLLSIYRENLWTTKIKANELCEYAENSFGEKEEDAIIYLLNFATNKQRECFEYKVNNLFETKWLVELIDAAMTKIYDYPINGKLYHEILFKQYLSFIMYSETEMLEIINVERSTYYDRKKEAIQVFAITLWGYVVPYFKGILKGEC